jgi:hypothetical protein
MTGDEYDDGDRTRSADPARDGFGDREPVVLVPADLDVEDRIVGPVTFRLAGWLSAAAAGTALTVLAWPRVVAVAIGVLLVAGGVVGGFYRPGSRPLTWWARPVWSYGRRRRTDHRTSSAAPSRTRHSADAPSRAAHSITKSSTTKNSTTAPGTTKNSPADEGPEASQRDPAQRPTEPGRSAARPGRDRVHRPPPAQERRPADPAPANRTRGNGDPDDALPRAARRTAGRVAVRTALAVTIALAAGIAVPIRFAHPAARTRTPAAPQPITSTAGVPEPAPPSDTATTGAAGTPSPVGASATVPTATASRPDEGFVPPDTLCLQVTAVGVSPCPSASAAPGETTGNGSDDVPWWLDWDGPCEDCG